MTETTQQATSVLVARYLAAWNEPEPARRRAAVAELWAPDGVEFVDGKQFRGLEELDARVTRTYEAFVGGGKYTVTGADDVSVHGDIVTFTAQLTKPDGEVDWSARVFLLLASDGLIREDYQLTVQPLPN